MIKLESLWPPVLIPFTPFAHWLIYLFNTHLQSAYYVLGTVLVARVSIHDEPD